MSIASIASSTATDALRSRAAADASGAPKAELGQDAFLTLMLAQLRNQDPLKPLEPQEFLGQLAQFSSVTGIQGMKDSVAELASSLRSSQVLEGATLVGRSVLAAGNAAQLDASGGVSGAITTPEGATSIDVTVKDASGALVRQFSVAPQAGNTAFSWDGTDSRGSRAAPGAYRIDVAARIGGATESLETMLQRRVDSVTLDPGTSALKLNTSAGSIALADVRRIM